MTLIDVRTLSKVRQPRALCTSRRRKGSAVAGGAAATDALGLRALQDLPLAYLLYVQQIVAHGSLLETAETLNCSQGFLSHKVEALEQAFGFRLFQRRGRGMTLTRRGEDVLAVLTPFLHGLKAVTRAGDATDGAVRTVRVVAGHAVMSYILQEPLISYQAAHADRVRFDLIADDLHMDLIRHDADLVIRPTRENVTGMFQVPLFQLVKGLFASQSYLDRYGAPQTVDDLDQHKLISGLNLVLNSHSNIEWILTVGKAPGKKRRADFTANNTECLVNLAKHGLGIVGAYPIMQHVKDSGLINVLPEVESEPLVNSICMLEASQNDELIKDLVKYLMTVFEVHRPKKTH